MLTGPMLGAAIESAREKKGVKKAELARLFAVKPPSIQDWVNKGTISKDKLIPLIRYFSDVVGPEHWGLDSMEALETPAGLDWMDFLTFAQDEALAISDRDRRDHVVTFLTYVGLKWQRRLNEQGQA